MDNAPVFFTGLANTVQIIEQLIQPRLCKICSSVLAKHLKSGELCSNCANKSKEPEITLKRKKSSETHSKDSSSSSFPNKRPLLPSPGSHVSNPQQQNNSEQIVHSQGNNNSEFSRDSASTPNRKDTNLKWESGIKARFETRSNFRPYSNRVNTNKKRDIQTTPSPQSDRSTHYIESPEILDRNFHTPRSSRWSSPKLTPTEELSSEIWRIYLENKQPEEIFHSKMRLRDKLYEILRGRFPNCGLYVVGSSMTGLGVKSSDIDMCLMLTDSEIDQGKEAVKILHIIRNLFRKYRFLQNVQVIPAKVPIIKFVDTVSGNEVDLNVNNAIGIRNTQLLSSYARMDERFPALVVLVKLWARCHNINDAKFNSLSSYSYVLMVIHYLQYRCKPPVLPCLQLLQPDKYQLHTPIRDLKLHEDLPNFVSENKKGLGALFIGFLKYFADEFNYNTDVMSVRLGTILPRESVKHGASPKNKEAHWKFICIEEPFDLTNTARSVFNEKVFREIQYTFEESWNRIKDTFDLNSVLG